MNKFDLVPFDQAFISVPVGNRKIQESEYVTTGSIRVVDQGQRLISGHTNRDDLIIDDGPFIVFGDHTRTIKYVDFPFVAGADGVRLFKATTGFEPEYLYLFLRSAELPADGYGRHSKHLKHLFVPNFSRQQQRQIAARLKAQLAEVDTARQAAQAQVRDAALLRQRLLRQAFDALNDVPHKSLGCWVESYRNGFGKRPGEGETGPIVLRIADVSSGKIDLSKPRRGHVSEKEAQTYRLAPNDLLFIRVNGAREIVGRCCIVSDDVPKDTIFNDHLIRVCLKSGIEPEFARFCASSPAARALIEEAASTSAGQLTINQRVIESIAVPDIPPEKQRQFVIRLQSQLAEAAAIAQAAAAQLAGIERLPQRLLAQAFAPPPAASN